MLNTLIKLVPVFRGIMIHPDAPVYLWSAQNLAAGDIQAAVAVYPMLFYPALIMFVHKLGVDWLWAGRLISLTASSLALLPFMSIARRFVSGWPFWVGVLLFIFFPELNSRGYAVLRDPLYLFLSLCCVHYALRVLDERTFSAFWGVVFFALLLPLVRVEGVFSAFLIGGMLLVQSLRLRGRHKKKLIAGLVGLVGAFLVGLSVSDIFQDLVRLDFFVRYYNKLTDGVLSVQPCLDALDRVSYSLPVASHGSNFWQVIERHWPWIYFIGILYVFLEIVGWPVFVMGLTGLAASLRTREPAKIFLVALFAGQTALMILFYLYKGFLEERYMLLPSLLLLIFSLSCLEPVFFKIQDILPRLFKRRKNWILAVFCSVLLLPWVDDSLTHRFRFHVPVLAEASLWAKKEIRDSDEKSDRLVFSNARRAAWFLGHPDIYYRKKINKQLIEQYLSPNCMKSSLFILLLSKRVPENMDLLDTLQAEYPLKYKVFDAGKDDKHIAIVVWD